MERASPGSIQIAPDGQLGGSSGSLRAHFEYDALGRWVRTIDDPDEPDHWATRHVYP